MPVPKQKQSKSRSRRRRANDAIKPKQLIKCDNCEKMKENHVVCNNCGYYRGARVTKKKAGKSKK